MSYPVSTTTEDHSTLRLENDNFYLGCSSPRIVFSDQSCVIGCKTITADAMDKLCKEWLEFRGRRERVIQSGAKRSIIS